MKEFFYTFLYQPIYNILVFLVDVLPGGDVGLAIVILTIFVKVLLLPLAHKSATTQAKMREVDPKLRELKERHKDNKEKQARAIMDLYRENGINPFSGFFLLLIQLPIIFALYYVFWKGLPFDPSLVYPFLNFPDSANFNFLGFIDLQKKSFILALLAAVSQYFQIDLSLPKVQPKKEKKGGEKESFQEEFTRNMSAQMRYVFPVMVFFISYTLSSAIALYWAVSNLFMIGHELVVRKKGAAVRRGEAQAPLA